MTSIEKKIRVPDEPGGEDLTDPNRLLFSAEVATLLDMSPETWRSHVTRGTAPPADDPDLDRPRNRRMPRWKLSTIAQWQAARRRRRRPQRGQEAT